MATKEDYLYKLGNEGIIKLYKKRWFVVTDEVIYYYVNRIDRTLCGQIKIRDIFYATSSRNDSFNKGSTWGFDLSTPGRIYQLYATTESERISWIEAINSRMTIIKKKDEENKNKTNEMLKDLKIWSSYNGEQDENDSSSSTTPPSNHPQGWKGEKKELEMEIEIKENLISKLEEEKIAFEQYAKELEDEKSNILKENEKLVEQLDSSLIESYKDSIKRLEDERDQLSNDLEVMSKDLDEERLLHHQAIKDRDALEKNFQSEKSDLIIQAQESESGKKKVLELIQSGTHHLSNSNNSNNSNIKNQNWSHLLFQIVKDNLQYRKQRDLNFIDNIKLKKKIEESLRIEREKILHVYDDKLKLIVEQDEEYRLDSFTSIIPIICQEINELLEYVNNQSNDLSTINDDQLLKFIDNYQPLINSLTTIQQQQQQQHISPDNNNDDPSSSSTSNSSFITISSSPSNSTNSSMMMMSDSILVKELENDEPKSLLLIPLSSLQINMETCKMDAYSLPPIDVVNDIQSLKRSLTGAKNKLQEYKDGLLAMQSDTSNLPICADSIDAFESRVEAILNKLEPFILQEVVIDDPIELSNRIRDLHTEFTVKIDHYSGERKKTESYLGNLERLTVGVEIGVESVASDLKDIIESLYQKVSNLYNQKMSILERCKRAALDIVSIKKKAQLIIKLQELQDKPQLAYVANQNDQLDVLVESVLHSFNGATISTGVIPPNFDRLGEGLYQFGTRKINTTILAGNLVVRVGGGFVTFEDFVLKYGRAETIKVLRLTSTTGSPASPIRPAISSRDRKSISGNVEHLLLQRNDSSPNLDRRNNRMSRSISKSNLKDKS